MSFRPTIMRKIEFDSGHRLVDHESKCAHVHGHRYVAEIYCTPMSALDSIGRVVDFSCIKAEVGGWIDQFWDHAMVVNAEDKELIAYLAKNNQRHFILDTNPTAENMAAHLLEVSKALLSKYYVHVTRIKLWETPNCFAEVHDATI